jgi:hypothetical protein
MLKMIDILSGVRTRTLGAHIAGNFLRFIGIHRIWYQVQKLFFNYFDSCHRSYLQLYFSVYNWSLVPIAGYFKNQNKSRYKRRET